MRTIEILAYSFAELSDSAKQTACDKWNESFSYPWDSEIIQCRDGLAAHFPGLRFDRDGDPTTYGIDDNILELKGKRLASWLWNNVISEVQTGQYRHDKKGIRANMKSRKSKMTFEVSCPFSGMSVDCAAMDPILDFVHGKGFSRSGNKWNETTLDDIIGDCFSAISKYVDDDIEYLTSLEAFAETCDSNDYEFNENGEML